MNKQILKKISLLCLSLLILGSSISSFTTQYYSQISPSSTTLQRPLTPASPPPCSHVFYWAAKRTPSPAQEESFRFGRTTSQNKHAPKGTLSISSNLAPLEEQVETLQTENAALKKAIYELSQKFALLKNTEQQTFKCPAPKKFDENNSQPKQPIMSHNIISFLSYRGSTSPETAAKSSISSHQTIE
jgi:hypothetical protein